MLIQEIPHNLSPNFRLLLTVNRFPGTHTSKDISHMCVCVCESSVTHTRDQRGQISFLYHGYDQRTLHFLLSQQHLLQAVSRHTDLIL